MSPAATITPPNSSGVVLPSRARAFMKAMSSFSVCILSSVISALPALVIAMTRIYAIHFAL